MRRLVAALAVISVIAAGCGRTGGSSDQVVVMAASSLVDVLGAINNDAISAGADSPPVHILASYAGSSALVAQLRDGAPADVLITASRATMETAISDGSVAGKPSLMATNHLVLAVAHGNPGNISSLTDLSDPSKVIGLCAPEVPCGALAARALDALGITAAVDTFEPNVRSLANKIQLGEIDAGLVYRTDAMSLDLEMIDTPELDRFSTEYLVASISAQPPAPVADFVKILTSAPAVRRLLAAQGFTSP